MRSAIAYVVDEVSLWAGFTRQFRRLTRRLDARP
jgi:hypothetical protein